MFELSKLESTHIHFLTCSFANQVWHWLASIFRITFPYLLFKLFGSELRFKILDLYYIMPG